MQVSGSSSHVSRKIIMILSIEFINFCTFIIQHCYLLIFNSLFFSFFDSMSAMVNEFLNRRSEDLEIREDFDLNDINHSHVIEIKNKNPE